MKRLQDIIRESILDDNIGDDSIVQMFFNNLRNTKSPEEFNNIIMSLKSYLDDEIGIDYKKALNKTKRNRSGHYLAIRCSENERSFSIIISSGPSQINIFRFFGSSTNLAYILRFNMSFYDAVFDNDYVYVLDDKWNELRKMIINVK